MPRVLVITVGETPQVVTETVHALVTRAEPWFPDRIVLATTRRAEDLFTHGSPARGLAPLTGASGRLRAMYEQLDFADRHVEPEILFASRASGAVLEDVRSDVEVSAFANSLLRIVREVTNDAGSELHVSLAGGRKTMSYLAGAVLSVYGRPRDVLTHVLIEPQRLEFASDFWWPGQANPVIVRDRDGKPTGEALDPGSARAVLHEAPFVRLRAFLTQDEIFRGDISFEAAVERANEALAIDRLVVDIPASEIRVGRYRLHLETREMAVMASVARAAAVEQPIVVSGKGGDRRPMLGGDGATFLGVWSRCLAAGRLASLYSDSDDGPDVTADPRPFDQACQSYRNRFDYSNEVGEPAARVRRKLGSFPKELAERVLAKGGLRTAFPPAGISIVLPPGVRL